METFSEWLSSSQKQRDALFAHSNKPIPDDRGELSNDIEKSIRAAEAAGAQLNRAAYYLTAAKKDALLAAKDLSPDAKGVAREILIADAVKAEQLLHDDLENLARSLNQRVRAEMNSRRSLL